MQIGLMKGTNGLYVFGSRQYLIELGFLVPTFHEGVWEYKILLLSFEFYEIPVQVFLDSTDSLDHV